MVQAADLDGLFLDLFSPFDDCGVPPEIGVGWCDVANALMVIARGYQDLVPPRLRPEAPKRRRKA